MYRAAICEDDPTVSKDLHGLCRQILSESGISFDITVFSGPEALLRMLEKDPAAFHVLLLDIKMEPMSGLELARCGRQATASVLFLQQDMRNTCGKAMTSSPCISF